MKRLPILILLLIPLFIDVAQSATSQLTCKSESRSWPQAGKMHKGNMVIFLRFNFSKDGTVKIYQGQSKVPFKGTYDKKVIKSVSTTNNGFERDLTINRDSGNFIDRYFVIHHGKQETAWIDKGNCKN